MNTIRERYKKRKRTLLVSANIWTDINNMVMNAAANALPLATIFCLKCMQLPAPRFAACAALSQVELIIYH